MKLLILGGTAWLGREITVRAMARDHQVTCIARGESGAVAAGARFISADRTSCDLAGIAPRADAVVELTWQPGLCRSALAALAARVSHWTFVSSVSVYADQGIHHGDESAELLRPATAEVVAMSEYGEAKVACEVASREAVGGRLLVVRPGLIGGAGDISDRSGAWVARAALHPEEPMLVPSDDLPTQVVDVGDLAEWIVRAVERRLTGVFDAVGPVMMLSEWIALARVIGRHAAGTLPVDGTWLQQHGVGEFMGPESMAMWIADPQWTGMMNRTGAKASGAGLTHIPREVLMAEVLEWEQSAGLDRVRRAGLSIARERHLAEAWAARTAT